MDPTNLSLAEKLQSLPKSALYIILFVATSIPLFFTIPIPNKESKASIDFYQEVQKVPEGSTVLIASDWTNATRGESAGEYKALLRILMRKKVKFAVYTTADPQAPQASKDVIRFINDERVAAKQKPYERWTDWVNVGYFPNGEGATNSIASNVRSAFADKKDFSPDGALHPVMESPVLKNIQKVEDFPALIIVTGSNTSNVAIERINSLPILLAVTGVMGPEMNVYYTSGQVKGLVTGLKGVYDIETLMQKDYPDQVNLDNGAKYYPTLHLALVVLIVTVIIGNLGMFLGRKRSEA